MNSIKNENSNLYEDIVDLKSTINLNWKSFSEYVLSNASKESDLEKSKRIADLLSSCKKLIDANIATAQDIRKIKEKISFQNNILETLPEKINTEYEEEKKRYLKLQNEISSKKSTLSKLNNELDKIRSKAVFKTAKNEVIIAEPNKANVEMNHEIQITRGILSKVIRLNNADKHKIIELTKELNELQHKMKILQNKYNTSNNINSNQIQEDNKLQSYKEQHSK